jgi:hypothetical protein
MIGGPRLVNEYEHLHFDIESDTYVFENHEANAYKQISDLLIISH